MSKLASYFNNLSEIITSEAKAAGFSSENADIGKSREYICGKLFREHIPKRLSVHPGGNIFNASGQESGQLDIIITHDMSLNFHHNHIVSCAAESVSAVIGVKSKLTKAEVVSSLKNIASVPQLDDKVISTDLMSRPSVEYVAEWPAFFVFAYDSISPQIVYEHVCTYLEQNPTPVNRIPRAIIVNGKYAITFIAYEQPFRSTDENFVRSDMKLTEIAAHHPGNPLFWMMIELAKSITWLDGMSLIYRSYYNEAFNT